MKLEDPRRSDGGGSVGGHHIGVDATCWELPRGFGRHARCLLDAVARVDGHNRYTFFVDSPGAAEKLPGAVDVRVVQTSQPTTEGASARGHRRFGDLLAMSRALADSNLDLLLFPTIYSYVPVISRARKVVIIHDVTAEAFPKLTLHSPLARLFWKLKVAMGRRQADMLVTVSEYSRRGIVERFRVPEERVLVLGEASDPIFRVLDTPGLTPGLLERGFPAAGRSVVYVGGFSPHKNLLALVDVFADLARRSPFADVRLVFVGEYRDEAFFSCFEEVRQRVQDHGIGERVLFTGFLPDDDLVVLLNLATVLVLPSLTEGFGLPAVEAAACGCPVIATRASPLPDVLGEAAEFIEPTRPTELEDALVRVLGSEEARHRMSKAGVRAASELSWDSVARELVETMNDLVAM